MPPPNPEAVLRTTSTCPDTVTRSESDTCTPPPSLPAVFPMNSTSSEMETETLVFKSTPPPCAPAELFTKLIPAEIVTPVVSEK
eukprot:2380075-Rhodomonas_salina.2